jgi:hypothetical protein
VRCLTERCTADMSPATARSGNLIGKSNFSEAFSYNVVQENFVSDSIPHRTEFDTAGPMKDELEATTVTVAFQFQFAHRKMVFKQIFFAAQSQVNEVAKLIQCTNICRSSGHHVGRQRLIHITETILGREDLRVATNQSVDEDR